MDDTFFISATAISTFSVGQTASTFNSFSSLILFTSPLYGLHPSRVLHLPLTSL